MPGEDFSSSADAATRLAAAWAEGGNCLAIVLCPSALRMVLQTMTPAALRHKLASSVDDLLAFAAFLLGREKGPTPGDWEGARGELLRLKALMKSQGPDDPESLAQLGETIRRALVLMGLPLPEFQVGVNGAVCGVHGVKCPPADE